MQENADQKNSPSQDEAGDLRTSYGEVVRHADLDAASREPDPGAEVDAGPSLAKAALAGDQAALDQFHDLAGLALPDVTEHCHNEVVRLSIVEKWVLNEDETSAHANKHVTFLATTNDCSSIAINAAELVAWILSPDGRTALARRGIVVPDPALLGGPQREPDLDGDKNGDEETPDEAQGIASAVAHLKVAETARGRLDYKTAAIEYLAAYKLHQDPDYIFHVGEVLRLAGDEVHALAHYERYTLLEGSNRYRGKAHLHSEELRRSIAAKQAAPRLAADAARWHDDEIKRQAAKQIEHRVMERLLAKLQAIRTELNGLKKTYEGSVSLRYQSLNDQCDLLEEILGVPRSHPRATQADR